MWKRWCMRHVFLIVWNCLCCTCHLSCITMEWFWCAKILSIMAWHFLSKSILRSVWRHRRRSMMQSSPLATLSRMAIKGTPFRPSALTAASELLEWIQTGCFHAPKISSKFWRLSSYFDSLEMIVATGFLHIEDAIHCSQARIKEEELVTGVTSDLGNSPAAQAKLKSCCSEH